MLLTLQISVPRSVSARGPAAAAAAAILNWVPGAAGLRAPRELRCGVAFSHWELWSAAPRARPLHNALHEQVTLHKAQRKSEKRLDLILLPRFYFYPPGIINELCQ